MRLFKLAVAALYAVTFVSAHLIHRDVWATYEKFLHLKDVFEILAAYTNDFNGALVEAMAVGAAADTLKTEYEAALASVNEATDLETGSSFFFTGGELLVAPHKDGLAALIAKEPLFAADGYNPLVLARLQELASASSQLWTVLDAKISADLSSSASAIAHCYAAAITAYS
ncbi:hypothetical protein DFP73DRAFT_634658 [Morchella snyderi]|nr:hypothetical protein DFP73DRAFT_634658 [Morchella snyderi]